MIARQRTTATRRTTCLTITRTHRFTPHRSTSASACSPTTGVGRITDTATAIPTGRTTVTGVAGHTTATADTGAVLTGPAADTGVVITTTTTMAAAIGATAAAMATAAATMGGTVAATPIRPVALVAVVAVVADTMDTAISRQVQTLAIS